MKTRLRINFSTSFNASSPEFLKFCHAFHPHVTAEQWQELRAVLSEIFVLSDLAQRFDIKARRIAEPLFLRKESERYYLPEDVVAHLESIGDVGELLEVGYRASQQPISMERLCEGMERLKFKTDELRQRAAMLKETREAARTNAVSL